MKLLASAKFELLACVNLKRHASATFELLACNLKQQASANFDLLPCVKSTQSAWLKFKHRSALSVMAGAVLLLAGASLVPAWAAENLRLRDGVSFFHDLDQGFPLLADKLDDVAVASGKPSFIFFGASGDLNTNRQAKRVVDLYKKYKSEQVKWIVIDVDHPVNAQAKTLIKTYYPGYIPAQSIFDKQGKEKWKHTGEVDVSLMSAQLDKLVDK
jgi:hypothetical protein